MMQIRRTQNGEVTMQNGDNQYVRSHGRCRAPRRGFTLPEVLTALAIISLTLAITVPSFGKFGDEQALRSETRSIQMLLHFARSEAIASRKYVAVEFDLQEFPKPDAVRLIGDATWNAGVSRWEGTEVKGMDARVVDTPHDVQEIQVGMTSYLTGQHYIVFAPTGVCGFDDGSAGAPTFELIIVRMDAV